MFYSIGSAKSRPTSEKEDGSPRGSGTTTSSSSLAPENLEREMTPTSTDYMDAIRLANVCHSPSLASLASLAFVVVHVIVLTFSQPYT